MASVTNVSRREGVPACLRTFHPFGRTLGFTRRHGISRSPWHARGVVLVLGFRGAWVSHAPPQGPKQPRP